MEPGDSHGQSPLCSACGHGARRGSGRQPLGGRVPSATSQIVIHAHLPFHLRESAQRAPARSATVRRTRAPTLRRSSVSGRMRASMRAPPGRRGRVARAASGAFPSHTGQTAGGTPSHAPVHPVPLRQRRWTPSPPHPAALPVAPPARARRSNKSRSSSGQSPLRHARVSPATAGSDASDRSPSRRRSIAPGQRRRTPARASAGRG